MDEFLDALAGFSPGFLFEDPRTVESPIYLAFVGLFVVAFLVGLAAILGADRFARGHRLHRRLLERYGAWAAWLGGCGMLVIGLRYANVIFFSKRLWTALNLLALCAVIIHLVRYRLRHYRRDLALYHDEERRRRFLPTPRRSAPPPRRGPRRRR